MFGGYAYPGNQSTAADRHHEAIEIRKLREELHRDRSLSRDRQRIVIRVDHRQSAFIGEALARSARFGQRFSLENDGGAQFFRIADFSEGRVERHDDGRLHAHAARMISDTLGMIAGRHGNDAA